MIKRIVPLIAIVIMFGAGPLKARAQGQDDTYPVTETPCPVAPALTEIEGVTVVCGTLTVPENYDEPDGNQIELVFAVLKSSSLSPAPDPVIYLHGGPGSAELRELAKMSERFAPIRQTRDVVIFDQRGAGFSNNRLACDVEYATQQDALRDYLESRIDGTAKVEAAVNLALFQACLDRFEAIGTDLSQYNTINNARDVVNLAAALGYEDFNLYGFSYGTQLALEVMRQEPTGLRSVILDSVAPADIKLYENFGQPNLEAILSLFAFCANDEACNEAYPDLVARFKALLERLDEKPLRTEDGSPVTANTVITALRQNDIRPGLGAFIPLMIWELEQGKLDTLTAISNNELPPPPPAYVDPLALRYIDLDLATDAGVLIDTALKLRQEARQLDLMADGLLARGNRNIELSQSGTSPAGRFDFAFHHALNEEPFDRRPEINQGYLALPLQGTTVEAVRVFINEHFSSPSAKTLLALTDEMTNEDVEELAQIIFGKARDYAQFFNTSLALSLYVCQEHVPFNTIPGARDTFDRLAIPAMGRGKLVTVENLIGTCQLFPTGLEPQSFHDPVRSDIPALILAGSADTQTAISWGQHVAENLENSHLIVFPETGHGAIRYSQCAKDVGAAFFNNPQGAINAACTEDLIPLFALPPEETSEP